MPFNIKKYYKKPFIRLFIIFILQFMTLKGKYDLSGVVLYCFCFWFVVLFQQQSKSKALELWNV